MAHKGKLYKLTLRRDFNLNVQTYRNGLADVYQCEIGISFELVPPYISGIVWDCLTRSMPNVSTLRWLSTFKPGWGGSLRLGIEHKILSTPDANAYPVGYLEFTSGYRPLVWNYSQPNSNSGFFLGPGAGTTFFDPTYVFTPPIFPPIFTDPKPY